MQNALRFLMKKKQVLLHAQAPPAQNSLELHFRFINFSIQPSLLESLHGWNSIFMITMFSSQKLGVRKHLLHSVYYQNSGIVLYHNNTYVFYLFFQYIVNITLVTKFLSRSSLKPLQSRKKSPETNLSSSMLKAIKSIKLTNI